MSLSSVESISTVTVQNYFSLSDNIFDIEWHVPNLKLLSAHNYLPFFPPNNGGTNVTILDILLRNAGLFTISFDLVVTRLRQTPNLTHLSLSLKVCVDKPFDYPPFEHPNLTSLEVELWQLSGAEPMKRKIVAKNVVHPGPWHSATTWNKCLPLGSQEICPILQEISYVECVRDDIRGSTMNDILYVLSKRETLEHLILEPPSFLNITSDLIYTSPGLNIR